MEIMGRIVNDKNSYRNIDHNHPNTLFDPNCKFCQNLARENKLTISNIKVESIYNNYSFMLFIIIIHLWPVLVIVEEKEKTKMIILLVKIIIYNDYSYLLLLYIWIYLIYIYCN